MHFNSTLKLFQCGLIIRWERWDGSWFVDSYIEVEIDLVSLEITWLVSKMLKKNCGFQKRKDVNNLPHNQLLSREL